MQVTSKNLSDTQVELTIVADEAMLQATKEHVLKDLARDVNLAGFRKGHAPSVLIEKSVDQNLLQSQFLDHAINDLYVEAVTQEKVRPVAQPEVSVSKFVPFTTLEITVKVEVVGNVTLPDYKKIKVKKIVEATTDKDVEEVIQNLLRRDAEKKDVRRASKDGDEVVIDFNGVDAKTKEAIAGADGTDYPLILGSNTFIPGFEPELIGLKPGDEKTFDITFPKDYGAKELQNKKVSFTVTVKTVRELQEPKLDGKFAAKVGPFKSVQELKDDIKKQLETEKETQADRAFENQLVEKVASGAKVVLPKSLVDDEIDRMEAEEKRNLVYRGQTWQEHLESEGKTEEDHHEGMREQAELRVKSGLVLAEVAETEGLTVTDDELNDRIRMLKQQYNDAQMQAELDKPENRRELMSRLLTEKTIERLASYAQ